jgi:large subunit ribosomal protein L19
VTARAEGALASRRAFNGEDFVMENIRRIEAPHLKSEMPAFRAGDNVKVHVQVVEGDKVRTQIFEGVVIARRGGGASESFIVRKVTDGVGVERIFPVHSPSIAKLEVLQRGKVRRSKLFYLRDRTGKNARIKTLRDKS